MDDFNTKLFIALIKDKSSIWNYKSPEFKNKMKRHRDWLEVCDNFIPDFHDKTSKERKLLLNRLQTKWKALRDGFVRNVRIRSKKSGPGAVYAKKYTYHDEMMFLIGKCKRDLPTWTPNKHPEATRNSDTEDTSLAAQARTPNDTFVDADTDKQFLLSLLKDFKRISDDYNLDAKGEIINVIRHYVTLSNHRESQAPVDVFTSHPSQHRTDPHRYAPDEISVKMVDKCVVITGRHEDKRGLVSEFKRSYVLPEDVWRSPEVPSDPKLSDGVLTVVAGRTGEEEVPIAETVVIKRETDGMEDEDSECL